MGSLAEKLEVARVLHRAGVLKPLGPRKTIRIIRAVKGWGRSPAMGFMALAIRQPDTPAVIDDDGSASFDEVNRRSNALARGLQESGMRAGDVVGIMCRNHRGFVEAILACCKVGANSVLLNTMFAAPQLTEVGRRENVSALLYDEEFVSLLEGFTDVRRFIVYGSGADPGIDDLIESHADHDLEPPSIESRFTMLTSGTTGTPKGARRGSPKGMLPVASLLSALPLRAGERTMVAAPLFHSWGLGQFQLGLVLGTTYVMTRRFDPEATLRTVAEHQCTSLAIVPVMMQRILALPDDVKRKYDLSSLRVTAASGSSLPGHLATEWMDTFGDNLYNFYGSTEVAMASVASPQDMRAAPGTAGRVPLGTVVKILDERGEPLPSGQTGRIFVANAMSFEGYTSGDDKERLGALLSSGDVGHFDESGRLFVDGRDDDMIISGGENLFPREVEDLIAGHDEVEEAAVIGVSDPDWGQRLRAFVVLKPEAKLDEGGVKAYVKTHLASYKVPRDVRFIDALPRNATGKVLKKDLER
ncbi:MAG: AMP-binding protein [Myxococcales bacterium]|nr:AMP-binding protein [Myxococcales bacterium]